ncbi:MAG: ABC transporter substrate-binding protein, partial [Promethearchaeota archaeon]
GYDPHGGYVDRLLFIVYPQEDIAHALFALQAGSVSSYDGSVPYHSVAELQANPAIDVTSELGSHFRQFTLQCQRFPTNLTGYRMALAYAVNKSVIVENSRGGYAQVMDNPVPIAFDFWSYESEMTSHFYEADIASANATLDAAHIIDTPDSPHPGYRYYDTDISGNWTLGDKRGDVWAPNGLEVELWTPADYSDFTFYMVLSMLAGMEKCGLQGKVVEVDFNTMITGLRTGEFSIAHFLWTIDPPGNPILLYDNFFSKASNNLFFCRFNHTGYDYNVSKMMEAPTRLEARNWAWNCCRILLAEMPMIVGYNDENIHAYRTDFWEGYVNWVSQNRMGGNPYTFEHIRLREEAGGPFGCIPTEYVTVLSEGMVSTNPIITDSEYAYTIFNLIYSKLWRVDPLDVYSYEAPDLAYAWNLEPTVASGDIQEGMRYTFQLYENVTWQDGTPFTAEDVQYSFMNIHPHGTHTAAKVANIYRVDTPDEYTVEIYSNKTGYLEFSKSTSVLILPKHIWSTYETNNFTWNPETPEDLTGTGCFQWVTRLVGQYIVLDRYPDWHFAVEQPDTRTPCPPPGPSSLLYLIIYVGILIIVLQVVVLVLILNRRRPRKRNNK